MSPVSGAARRHGWLELLQQSGPFLTAPVVNQIWPAGLPAVPTEVRATVRAEVAQLLETSGRTRGRLAAVLFGDALDWGDALVTLAEIPASLSEVVGEHRVVVRPDFAFFDSAGDEDASEVADSDSLLSDLEEDTDDNRELETTLTQSLSQGPWKLLGMWSAWGNHPLVRKVEAGWAASPVERLAALLRARDVPVGVVSDGRWWALVWAPRGRPVGAAVWDATLWSEEPETFAGFVALLARRRFLGVSVDERLPALLARSAEAQEEVTNALGDQVRAAVEMLVDRFDELDRNADGAILRGVSDDDVYAAVVTVMMRVLFLLFAEERRLLPSDDDLYDSSYSVGRLVEQLEQRAAIHGEQTLEHRSGAWQRLLAVARALHQGVAHENLRLPPYGGDMFDPDRYPWLEDGNGRPPPIDDLTVLRMLQAVQYVQLRGERRRLTFRAFDVEQIGYVYEGLLELEVRTSTEPILKLRQKGKKGITFVGLSDAINAVDKLEEWTASTYIGEKNVTPARRNAAARSLNERVDAATVIGLRESLGSDGYRLEPLAALLRCDDRARPIITSSGGRYVASSTRRASTGAHYTPRSLAEEIVQHALEPLVYRPGPLVTLDSEHWELRPSTEILGLRVTDIAMGSGAFLVAACRYLADRIVEAWDSEGDLEASRALVHQAAGTADAEVEPVVLKARRLVAEHCLYGVDVNPLAVEMAKLSMWLVTMDRERPFGFLDDRFVCGDSLLGVSSLAQLETLRIDPRSVNRFSQGVFDLTAGWRGSLAKAADTRRRITATPVVTVRDVEHKERLLAEAQALTEPLRLVAEALTGVGLRAASLPARHRSSAFGALEQVVWTMDKEVETASLEDFAANINGGLPLGKERRRPLHWPLVFPEVFADTTSPGFDAVIGNPPFLGGMKISGALGSDFLAWLVAWDGDNVRGSCDLAARFVLRADALLRPGGQLGYVTTNTLLEGATLEVGLLQLERRGWTVRRGTTAHPWPSSSANLSIVEVWANKGSVVSESVLDGEPVPHLTVDLQPFLTETGRPLQLEENEGRAFQGSIVLGLGFTMDPEEAQVLITEDPKNADVLFPYVNGADLNRQTDSSGTRWIVNFREQDEDHCRQYRGPWLKLERDVKPERMTKDVVRYPRMVNEWWKFWQYRQGLEEAMAHLGYVLAISRVGNVMVPVRVSTGPVFSEACVVFALEDYASLSVLSSSAHQVWTIRYTSTLETRIRYAPSDVFLTFPRPGVTPELEVLGQALDVERRSVMIGRSLGLTKLYNEVHNPDIDDHSIVRLRELHERIDGAVASAYGWDDLDLDVGHHRTKIGVRWTVSPKARYELLDRLLIENHQRASQQ